MTRGMSPFHAARDYFDVFTAAERAQGAALHDLCYLASPGALSTPSPVARMLASGIGGCRADHYC